MSRPLGAKNVEIPDPPFVFDLGEYAKFIIMPSKNKDGEWEFEATIEMGEGDSRTMTMEEFQDFETMVRNPLRWINKIERAQERLQMQMETLQEKLNFLRR